MRASGFACRPAVSRRRDQLLGRVACGGDGLRHALCRADRAGHGHELGSEVHRDLGVRLDADDGPGHGLGAASAAHPVDLVAVHDALPVAASLTDGASHDGKAKGRERYSSGRNALAPAA